MIPVFIAVCVVAGIIISVLRIKRLNETRKAEREKEDERFKVRPSDFAAVDSQIAKDKPTADFVSVVKDDPFAGALDDSSLSPAQLNEWLLDFAAAEKAGANRPEPRELPAIARRVYAGGCVLCSADKSCYREKLFKADTSLLFSNKITAALQKKESGLRGLYVSFYKNKN